MALGKRILVLLLFFLLSLLMVFVDQRASDFTHHFLRPYDGLLQFFTAFGDGRFLIPLCGVLWVLFKTYGHPQPRAPLCALSSLLISGFLTQILKTVFGRPRPYTFGDDRYLRSLAGVTESVTNPYELFQWFSWNKDFASFPSGHSTAVFSVVWILAKQIKNIYLKCVLFSFAILVSFTRVALAKHYLADTFSGAVIGIMTAELLWHINLKSFSFSRVQGPQLPSR